MLRGSLLLLTFLLMSFSTSASAADPASPYGLWLTENQRSAISVTPCVNDQSTVCGQIHWIIEGGMQYDTKNPDETRRNQPMCGLVILGGFHQSDANNWVDGEIYKADEGDFYKASLQMLPSGKMLVRGYVGMPLFGKSQTWTRVNPADYPQCTPAKPQP